MAPSLIRILELRMWESIEDASRHPICHHEQAWPSYPHSRGTGPRCAIAVASGSCPALAAGPNRLCRDLAA